MIGAGNLALAQAAERYRADRGTRFKTYAQYVVHGAIIDSVRRKAYRAHMMKSIDDLGDRLRVAPVGQAAIDADRFQGRLGKVIAELPTLQRRVLILRYAGDVVAPWRKSPRNRGSPRASPFACIWRRSTVSMSG